MIKKLLSSLLLSYSLLSSQAPKNLPRKPKAVIYVDAYADEEFRHDKTYCRSWQPCIERVLSNVENYIVPQIKSAQRFKKHYSDLDIVVKGIKQWRSKDLDKDLLMGSAYYALNEFVKSHKIKGNETDFRLAFTSQLLFNADGTAYSIPSRYVLVRTNKHLEDVLRHELGHAFGLYHNDTMNNQMHHIEVYPQPKFGKEALELLADRVRSIILARNKRANNLSSLVCYLQKSSYLKTKPLGVIELQDYATLHYSLSINASGSISISYDYVSTKPKLPKKLYKLKKFLKKLGLKEDTSELIFYSAKFSSNGKTYLHTTLNIEDETFLRFNKIILSWLEKNNLILSSSKDMLVSFLKLSELTGVRLYDCITYSKKW